MTKLRTILDMTIANLFIFSSICFSSCDNCSFFCFKLSSSEFTLLVVCDIKLDPNDNKITA